MSTTFIPMDSLVDASSSSQDSIKSSGSNQTNKNRKGSLSAVIDKLKSAQHVNDESPPNTPTLSTPSQSMNDTTNLPSSAASSGHPVSKEKITSNNTPSINLSNGNRTRADRRNILSNLLVTFDIFYCSHININYIGQK